MQPSEKFQKKQYTVEQVEELLKAGDKSLREIINAIGCSKSTAENRIRELEATGRITKRNVGTEKKPLWMYRLTISA